MGEVELLEAEKKMLIRSQIICYGEAATDAVASQIAADIEQHWNAPEARIKWKQELWQVQFCISGMAIPDLAPEEVWYNLDPQKNYFRIQEYVVGDISYTDGLHSNTGVFKLANLQQTSTTAAHEYGHGLGLDHPADLDFRGKGRPGIMYPRGTLCDAGFQYWPHARSGEYGGTLNPVHRHVRQQDIEALKWQRLRFDTNGKARLGDFTSIYHFHQEPAH